MRKLILIGVLVSLSGGVSLCRAEITGNCAVLSAQGGRFIFGQVSSFRRDQYLLDSQTGRMWVQV